MSSKLTKANELPGMKDALGGIVQMMIIKRNLSLWWRSVSQRFHEGILGSMKNSDSQADFEEYTYLYVTKLIDR